MLQPSNLLPISPAGGGVCPERRRGARRVADTVDIHTKTIRTARELFKE